MTEPIKTVAVTPLGETKLAEDVSTRFGIPQEQLLILIKNKLIKVPQNGEHTYPVTDQELALFLSIVQQYGLNPMLGQVHGWRDWRGEMNTMIGYDGWVQKAREFPTYRGVSYKFGDMIPSPDGEGQPCWEWVQAIVKDIEGGELEQVPVFLEEWYVRKKQGRKAGPWQNQTRHKIHVVTFRLAIREVYGFGAGTAIDEDAAFCRNPTQGALTDDTTARLAGELNGFKADVALPLVPENGYVDYSTQGPLGPGDGETDPPESTTPLLDKLEVKACHAATCKENGTNTCLECGEMFCGAHMGDDLERCAICFFGGE